MGNPNATTWKVTGKVDKGAITFPNLRRISVVFNAANWEEALVKAGEELNRKSNQLGTPPDVEKVERIRPVVR